MKKLTPIEELKAYCSTLSHEGLNELYQTVRKSEDRIFVRETRLYENKFNWKNPFKLMRKERILYEMLWDLKGQVQIVHATYEAEAVETFLLGFIYGLGIDATDLNAYKEKDSEDNHITPACIICQHFYSKNEEMICKHWNWLNPYATDRCRGVFVRKEGTE